MNRRKKFRQKIGLRYLLGARCSALLLIIFSLSPFACAPPPKTTAVPSPSLELEVEKSLAAAEKELNRGCYYGFREAVSILEPLVSRTAPWPRLRGSLLPLYIKSLLLLGIREKEVGLSTSTLEKIAPLLSSNKDFADLVEFYEIARAVSVQSKGVMAYDDRKIEARIKSRDWEKEKLDWERLREERARRLKELERKAQEDELAAYFWLAGFFNLYYESESNLKPRALLDLFPCSRLVRFKIAVTSTPVARQDLLEELLKEEPEFYEAHYFLGEVALNQGLLLTAEKHFLEAWKAIPASPIMAISLASVYFHLEELEKSLEMYEATLAILPQYREAMLGRAICLSFLGRHEEAMQALREMIELGYWLMGEAHYWLAWNLYYLNQFQEALPHCEEAKGRLPTNSQVYSLTGAVALELNNLTQAEENLLKALEFDAANAEALLNLARLEARRENWPKAADYYEKAGRVYENQVHSIQARMKEIEASELSPERKQAQWRRKASQLESVSLTRATTIYNAATCYFNAGKISEALRLAEEASSHPALKQRANELISKIKRQ